MIQDKKKVMIIGAGAGQVPIIECCKKHGLETLVVSPVGAYPGIDKADIHIEEDIYNVERLIEIGRKEKISYVISDQSDYAVPIVAKIAEKLSLSGNSSYVSETYTFKSKFRQFCKDNDIPSPNAYIIKKGQKISELPVINYPVLVKPSDSQGSRGISKIDNSSQLEKSLDLAFSFSKKGYAVIEDFFEGKEIVCEGFVINGIYYNVAFGDREYFNIPEKFIPSKTIFPSTIPYEIKKKIIENEKKIATLLKPNFGIVHSEYIVNGKGDFVVIESALRGGGVYIASHLIPFTTGVDLTEVLYQAMIGNSKQVIDILTHKKNLSVAEYLCFYLKEGIVTEISKFNRYHFPDVKIIEIDNINAGDIINKFEHKGQRKGPILIVSKSFQALKDSELKIKEALKINIDNLPGICWS